RDYTGTAWYRTGFRLPWGWRGQRIYLRFNAVSYVCEVWLNGMRLGAHEGGHLPFAFDVTDHVKDNGNVLVARVDGHLLPDRVPPGGMGAHPEASFNRAGYPDTTYDFFPYTGIHRPVILYTEPEHAIKDITVTTDIEGTTGIVKIKVTRSQPTEGTSLTVTLRHPADGYRKLGDAVIEGETAYVAMHVPDAHLWSPQEPNLYELTVGLAQPMSVLDSYTLQIGIRTIAVKDEQLLLNGEPVKLVGFGRHEDFPVVGKGLLPALIVKDYALMDWMGANSFRTSHYPYSEQMMDMADRLGFMVIDETPAVGLFYLSGDDPGLAKRNALCQQMLREMIDRDKNHPSVIMWSLANEPHSARLEARAAYERDMTVMDNPSKPQAVNTFRELAALARELDPSRPITLVSHEGAIEEAFAFVDVVCLNRYFGWYTQSGQIDRAIALLEREIDLIHEMYPKPFILTEFGADTLPGHHAQPPEMFSEEWQAEYLVRQIELTDAKPWVVGQHIWNMCDFKTSQGTLRVNGMNYKGVFTRDRRPKLAAHRVRALWNPEG
ncbi:MAG: glycoside hydrolase family 2 TIM barrel-domain containing protein, partial [Chloroflexota bacterium]